MRKKGRIFSSGSPSTRRRYRHVPYSCTATASGLRHEPRKVNIMDKSETTIKSVCKEKGYSFPMWPCLCIYSTGAKGAGHSLPRDPALCTLSEKLREACMSNRWQSLSSLILSRTHGGILIKTHLTLHPSKFQLIMLYCGKRDMTAPPDKEAMHVTKWDGNSTTRRRMRSATDTGHH